MWWLQWCIAAVLVGRGQHGQTSLHDGAILGAILGALKVTTHWCWLLGGAAAVPSWVRAVKKAAGQGVAEMC